MTEAMSPIDEGDFDSYSSNNDIAVAVPIENGVNGSEKLENGVYLCICAYICILMYVYRYVYAYIYIIPHICRNSYIYIVYIYIYM
jgi:hypothetical protein